MTRPADSRSTTWYLADLDQAERVPMAVEEVDFVDEVMGVQLGMRCWSLEVHWISVAHAS